MKINHPQKRAFLYVLCTVAFFALHAQETPSSNAQELADKLSNPVSSLISVPLQSNVDYDIGPYGGSKYTLNFQPVIPFSLNSKLNLITRLVLPIVDQHDIVAEGSKQFGLSDATLSAFFAPAKSHGIMWGLGPAFLIPTGTSDFLSTRKWGIGPTALILKQVSGLTLGFLVNQLWSFAGDDSRKRCGSNVLPTFFREKL